jgi:predicted nucleic acid-binding protein
MRIKPFRFLLDTNVISETVRLSPNKYVAQWLCTTNLNNCYLSVVTLGEIRKGVVKLRDDERKQALLKWLEDDLPNQFDGRIIEIDKDIANKWGHVMSVYKTPQIDALLAASALERGFALATRNTKDFINIPELELVNPWMVVCNGSSPGDL